METLHLDRDKGAVLEALFILSIVFPKDIQIDKLANHIFITGPLDAHHIYKVNRRLD